MTTYECVRDIIVDNLGHAPEEVKPEAMLAADLDADSLAAVEITLAIEAHFDIDILDEEMQGDNSVQAIVDLVDSKLAARAA